MKIKRGTTSKKIRIFIQDSSSTTGAGLASLVYNSASLTAYYHREGDAAAVQITLVDATVGTWVSGGFKAVDNTNMPGLYELGLPNAAIASGEAVIIYLKGATNMAPLLLRIELDAVDYQDAQRFGLASLPNANAAANGGLPTVDASNRVTANTTQIEGADATDQIRDAAATGILSTPANKLVTDGTGRVTVGTNADKTGYALTIVPPTTQQIWEYATRSLTDKAGFALSTDERNALVAAIEVELANDATGEALMQAIADKLVADFDIELITLNAIRDAILNRSLAGNHDSAGTVGLLLQKLAVAGTLANTSNADTFKADVSDLPTTAELEARTLPAAQYATEANQQAIIEDIASISIEFTEEQTTALAAAIGAAIEVSGLTTEQAAQLLSAYQKTLGLGTSVLVATSPVSTDGQSLSLTRGDDYYAADGRSLEWTNDTWPNVTGASVRLTVGSPAIFYADGTVVDADQVRVELPAAKTALLSPNANPPFELRITLASGRQLRPIIGKVTVASGPTP